MERAIWDYDLTLYYALMPAALEAAGNLAEEEHYAIKEGLEAADRCKAARQRAREKHP